MASKEFEMVVVNGIRYRPEDAERLKVKPASKAKTPENKARQPQNKEAVGDDTATTAPTRKRD